MCNVMPRGYAKFSAKLLLKTAAAAANTHKPKKDGETDKNELELTSVAKPVKPVTI